MNAFRIPTCRRCRPEGALTNSRCTHHRTPRNGATTQCAASTTKTARRPACASAQRGSRLFLNVSCAATSALARSIPTFSGFSLSERKNWRTWVGLRTIPVSASMLAAASATVAGGCWASEAFSGGRGQLAHCTAYSEQGA